MSKPNSDELEQQIGELFADYGLELMELNEQYPDYEDGVDQEEYDAKELEINEAYTQEAKSLINKRVREVLDEVEINWTQAIGLPSQREAFKKHINQLKEEQSDE